MAGSGGLRKLGDWRLKRDATAFAVILTAGSERQDKNTCRISFSVYQRVGRKYSTRLRWLHVAGESEPRGGGGPSPALSILLFFFKDGGISCLNQQKEAKEGIWLSLLRRLPNSAIENWHLFFSAQNSVIWPLLSCERNQKNVIFQLGSNALS